MEKWKIKFNGSLDNHFFGSKSKYMIQIINIVQLLNLKLFNEFSIILFFIVYFVLLSIMLLYVIFIHRVLYSSFFYLWIFLNNCR
jgi:hypothetical protein